MTTEISRKERKSRWWLCLSAIMVPAITLVTFAGYRLYCVVALQNAVDGTSFIGTAGIEWQDKVIDYLEVKARKRHMPFPLSLRQKCHAVLLSRIDYIGIGDPKSVTPEYGAALARFPHLRIFEFTDITGTLPEKDVTMLLAEVRRMKRLEAINLFSIHVTDGSFAVLAGHPALKTVDLELGSITPEIAATLKTLPNLRQVTLNTVLQRHQDWVVGGVQQAFRDSLPGVKVEFVE